MSSCYDCSCVVTIVLCVVTIILCVVTIVLCAVLVIAVLVISCHSVIRALSLALGSLKHLFFADAFHIATLVLVTLNQLNRTLTHLLRKHWDLHVVHSR